MQVPPVLQVLSPPEASRLLKAGRVTVFARRAVLVHEGERADSLHIVLSGRVAVRVTKPSGDTAIVNILGPNDSFGEVSLLGQDVPARTADVVALEPARTLSIPAGVFNQLREHIPGLERLVSHLLARRVQELTAQLLEAMYDPLEQRVARRLLSLGELYGTKGPAIVPLTQEELSQLVGGTRPSVNQILRSLVSSGALELRRGQIVVVDPRALARICA